MAVTATLTARFKGRQTGSNDFGGGANTVHTPDLETILNFSDGTTANKADILWADRRTIAASGEDEIDLAGVLADAFGATITAVEVVAIFVKAADGNTNDVVLGDATAPIPLFGGTNPTFSVKPGGFFFVAAPNAAGQLTVGAGSTDDLKVANSSSGSSVTYDIAILARSA